MAFNLDLGAESEFGRKAVIVSGVASDSSYVSERWLHIGDEIVFNELSQITVEELLASYDTINIEIEKIDDVWLEVELTRSRKFPKPELEPSVSVSLRYFIELWAKPWSIYDQFYEIHEQFKILGSYEVDCDITDHYDDGEPEYNLLNGYGFIRPIGDQGLKLADLYESDVSSFKNVHILTEAKLSSNVDLKKLVTYFNFPDSVKIACEQYLIYFSQFLHDLGVQAETELVNSGEITLLKVKPISDSHALDEIRYLLSSYLSIASDVNVGLSPYQNKDISVIQLESNVLHLRSQLALAGAINEAKQTTIDNLRLSNYATQVVENAVEIESPQMGREKKSPKEPLLGGIIVLSEWEMSKGVTINFAEIARRLKRKIGK